jgi:hypothetical protein
MRFIYVFACHFLFSGACAKYLVFTSRHQGYGIIILVSGADFYHPLFPGAHLFSCTIQPDTPCTLRKFLMDGFNLFSEPGKMFRKKQVLYDSIQDFFYLFGFIQPIRQINNIFIPLSFHWRSLNINPDWNTRWFKWF